MKRGRSLIPGKSWRLGRAGTSELNGSRFLIQDALGPRTRLVDLHILAVGGLTLMLYFVLPFKTLPTDILIFALGAVSFNLLLGYTGLLSFGQAAFFGSGAYATGLLLIHLQWHPLLILLLSACFAASVAAVIGFLSIRQVGIYFVMLTLAFNQLVYFIAYQWKGLTGGDDGLLNIARPNLRVLPGLTLQLQTSFQFFIFVWVIFVLSIVVIRRITDSPFGRILVAVRENPDRARAVGYNIFHYKLLAFIISGFFTGLAGGLYTLFLRMVPITAVEGVTSSDFAIMSLVGGTRSLYGPIIGAAIVKIASEFLSQIWSRWMIVLGLIFIAFVLFMRGGLWGLMLDLRKKLVPSRMEGEDRS
jgi:branched-chain amino acid transport system permease protein